MHTNAELRDAALVAADIIADLDRLGVRVASVHLGRNDADIVIQVASAFDRAVVAAALGLPTCELIGSVSNPLRESTGTVVHDLGEFRVAVYGPASDRGAVPRMNTRPLPPSCPTCGGEGALEADPADVTCPACHGTGEAPASLRVGVVAVACIGAAIVGGFIPAGWWRSIDLREWVIGAVVVAAVAAAARRASRAGGAS